MCLLMGWIQFISLICIFSLLMGVFYLETAVLSAQLIFGRKRTWVYMDLMECLSIYELSSQQQ